MTHTASVQKSLERRYLVYTFITHLWFLSAIWLYFFRLFITDREIGILDGIAFAIALLAEVPAGALADRFGRHRILRFGWLCAVFGYFLQAFSSGFWTLFMTEVIMMIGFAFISGADTALFYEALGYDQESPAWRKLVTRGSQYALVGSLIGTLTGGWLFTLNPQLPFITAGVVFSIGLGIIWNLRDTRPQKDPGEFREEVRQHLRDIVSGFRAFRSAELRRYILIIVLVQGLFYSYGWGLLRLILLDRFHFSPVAGSWAIAVGSLLTVGILGLMHRYAERLYDAQIISIITLSCALALVSSIFNIGWWGFFAIFALYAGDHLLTPTMSEILNKRAPSGKRTTVLSVAQFLRALPYIILAPIIGYLNTHDNLEYFLVSYAVLMVIALYIYLYNKNNSDVICIPE